MLESGARSLLDADGGTQSDDGFDRAGRTVGGSASI